MSSNDADSSVYSFDREHSVPQIFSIRGRPPLRIRRKIPMGTNVFPLGCMGNTGDKYRVNSAGSCYCRSSVSSELLSTEKLTSKQDILDRLAKLQSLQEKLLLDYKKLVQEEETHRKQDFENYYDNLDMSYLDSLAKTKKTDELKAMEDALAKRFAHSKYLKKQLKDTGDAATETEELDDRYKIDKAVDSSVDSASGIQVLKKPPNKLKKNSKCGRERF